MFFLNQSPSLEIVVDVDDVVPAVLLPVLVVLLPLPLLLNELLNLELASYAVLATSLEFCSNVSVVFVLISIIFFVVSFAFIL
jgi:hypothetical protein